jgi:membrane-bound lytic murein transglycosylase A
MKNIIFATLFCSFSALSVEVTPTELVGQSLNFSDDLNFKNLDLVIERQLESFKKNDLVGEIKFGGTTYPKKILKDSLLLLKELANDAKACQFYRSEEVCSHEFSRKLNSKFSVYKPIAESTHYTVYYSPDVSGSRAPSERFVRPVYRLPEDRNERNFSRTEIDYHGALRGHELFWLENAFLDIYLMHIEGGGRITINNPDGTSEVKYLSYTGKNDKPFKWIHPYMIEQGMLKKEEAGISFQRKYLEQHPERQEEIFSTCPSYVYFEESSQEPVGLNGISLTEGRSLAIDSRIYKTMGLINFVKTRKPREENGSVSKVPFSRFFIAQDTGGAIRGPARCDLYFGYGPEAQLAAYGLDDVGEQYFLIKRSISNRNL